MRSAGGVLDARGLGAHDHVCWPYLDRADFLDQALGFLSDGLAEGCRVAFVAAGKPDELRDQLRPIGDVDDLLARGDAVLLSVSDTYQPGVAIGPAAQVEFYAEATAGALAHGYRGFRVAADATALVRSEPERDSFARYEHLVDRAMWTMPFSALCGYDRSVLGDPAVAELACLHPLVGAEVATFQLFAPDGHDLAIVGEIDALSAEAFAIALDRAAGAADDGPLSIDASGLVFIDHHGLLVLDELARSSGARVTVHHAPRMAARLVELLGLTAVEIEVRR